MRNKHLQGKLTFVSIVAFLTTVGVLPGCSHHSPAPVFNLSDAAVQYKSNNRHYSYNSSKNTSTYQVMPGDTLFSIAWQHSMDYQELARINQLKNNLIYPGQKLHFAKLNKQSYFDSESLLTALNREVLNKPLKQRYDKSKFNNRSKEKKNKKTKSSHIVLNTNSKQIHKTTAINKARNPKDSSLKWIWPIDGKILTRFSTKSNASKGVDIAGKRGQPVRATAPGRVVYQGNGLRGYGNLVIIKHNRNYLSAYAHNNTIHVAENEVVKAGQRIADVGSSGAPRDKLHFEIRYKGKPVDPLNYLPEIKF